MPDPHTSPNLEAAAWFLEYDLRDSADSQRLRAKGSVNHGDPEMARLHDAAAERLEELAGEVDTIPPALLLEYAQALEREQAQDGPDKIHCSMTLEIGFAINPQSIDDVCRIYVQAVECAQRDPRFADGGGDMVDYWWEYQSAGHA